MRPYGLLCTRVLLYAIITQVAWKWLHFREQNSEISQISQKTPAADRKLRGWGELAGRHSMPFPFALLARI